MATKTHYFTGHCKWGKFKQPDQFGKYSMDFYPDKPSMKEYKASGIQVSINTDDEGKEFVKLKRDHEKLIKGEMVEFGPPRVAINIGKDPESGESVYEPFDGLVGNGSFVTVRVVSYDGQRGKGHRLEGIGVEDLIEFIPEQKELPF